MASTSDKKGKTKVAVSAKPIEPRGYFDHYADMIRKLSKKSKAWKVLFVAGFGIAMALWVGIILYLTQLAIAYVFVKILPKDVVTSNIVSSVYQVIVYAISSIIIIFVPWRLLKYRTSRDELGFRGLPTWTDIGLAPIGLIVSLILAGGLTAAMMALMPGIDWEQAQEVGYSNLYQLSDFALAFICLVVLAPVCEELIFRGWLYGKLRFRMPAVPAIIIVSLLFGIVHGQINVGVVVFSMSVCMCIMRELTGTVWSGILLHMAKNALAFYFLFVG